MPVFNSVAIDYDKGVDIYDPVEKRTMDEEEARKASQEVKKRLTLRGRTIGCWVMTTEEAKQCFEER